MEIQRRGARGDPIGYAACASYPVTAPLYVGVDSENPRGVNEDQFEGESVKADGEHSTVIYRRRCDVPGMRGTFVLRGTHGFRALVISQEEAYRF